MSERTVWLVVAFLVAFVAMSPIGCTMHQNATVRDMAAKGVDPIRAACAVKSDMMPAHICVEVARARSVSP